MYLILYFTLLCILQADYWVIYDFIYYSTVLMLIYWIYIDFHVKELYDIKPNHNIKPLLCDIEPSYWYCDIKPLLCPKTNIIIMRYSFFSAYCVESQSEEKGGCLLLWNLARCCLLPSNTFIPWKRILNHQIETMII